MLAQKLKQGDTIGVIAPNKALKSTDKVYLENATRYFESLGLKVKYGKYLYSDDEYCAGTPYMPQLKESILFLEDFHLDIIQWNYMLEQISQMGVLNKAIVFGYMYHLQCEENNKHDIVKELRKINTDIPVVKTNDFGHIHGNSIIPIGAEATINEKEESIIVSNYLK